MEQQVTAAYLDDSGTTMPVQWCFKAHLADGRVMDLILRRVKEGNETAIEEQHEGDTYLHLRGRYSNAQTLLERLNDDALSICQHDWIASAMGAVLAQMETIVRQKPTLWELFAPKGKMEIYHKDEAKFRPQYINGNHTLKLHTHALLEQDWLIAHLVAQHLDYPFGSGERRYSTSRLFDLCYAAEKVIAPKGLAAKLDAQLQEQGIYREDRQACSDYDHVAQLLDGKSAAIRNSYERVLQRERFAAMIVAQYIKPIRGVNAPLLNQFRQLIEVDLLAQQKQAYKTYPSKGMDQLATSLHVPLMMIFNNNKQTVGKHDSGFTDSVRSY